MRSFFTKVFRLLAALGFDVSRYRGLFTTMAGLLLAFVVMHYALALSLGANAKAVHPRQRPIGWQTYEKVWGRVAAVDHLYNRGQLPADTKLGVYIGVSTTATGIQRKFLDSDATIADRWIVLTGAGLSFENLESVMQPIVFCSLKPAVVVMGSHPQMLVGERYLGDEPTFVPQAVVGRRFRALKSRYLIMHTLIGFSSHWGVFHRVIMGHFLRSHIFEARLWLFNKVGMTAEKMFPPSPEPWDDDPLWLWNLDDRENEFAHLQLDFWSKRGHYNAENYDAEGKGAQALVRMLRRFREMGSKVYIIIMPMRSYIRSHVPPNAKGVLIDVIKNAFPGDPPPIYDMEDTMPDRYFTDEAHLSKAGSTRLSKLVAEKLTGGMDQN